MAFSSILAGRNTAPRHRQRSPIVLSPGRALGLRRRTGTSSLVAHAGPRLNRGSRSLAPVSPMLMDLVDPLFEGMFRAPSTMASRGMRSMPIDIVETEDSFEVKADIPGVNKSDISVDIDGDTVSLSLQHSETKEENESGSESERKVHRMERSSMFVSRSVRLPDTADLEGIGAKYENGVLSLHIPKKQHAVMRRRAITVE